MLWFKKKEKIETTPEENEANEGDESGEDQKPAISGNVEVELTKIKSSLEALNEVRKANAEQFTRLSEQIGEIRGALMDSNKAISVIEVASTKAIDMVNSVQPDKLMVEVRRMDGKSEALKANIEANEAMMKDIMKEMKDMRSQMTFYKGVDQVVKLQNEIKQELIDVKKTEGVVGKHADRVETIFVEVEKKFYDFEKFNEAVKELDRSFKKISTDFDKIRVTIEEKADKKEFVKLVDKFSDFEKHTTNILKLLDQKSKNTVGELNALFTQLRVQLEKKYSTKLDIKELSNEDTTKPKDVSKETKEQSKKSDDSKITETESKDTKSTAENSDTKTKLSNIDLSLIKQPDNVVAEIASVQDKVVSADVPKQKENDGKDVKKGMFGFFKK